MATDRRRTVVLLSPASPLPARADSPDTFVVAPSCASSVWLGVAVGFEAMTPCRTGRCSGRSARAGSRSRRRAASGTRARRARGGATKRAPVRDSPAIGDSASDRGVGRRGELGGDEATALALPVVALGAARRDGGARGLRNVAYPEAASSCSAPQRSRRSGGPAADPARTRHRWVAGSCTGGGCRTSPSACSRSATGCSARSRSIRCSPRSRRSGSGGSTTSRCSACSPGSTSTLRLRWSYSRIRPPRCSG